MRNLPPENYTESVWAFFASGNSFDCEKYTKDTGFPILAIVWTSLGLVIIVDTSENV